MTFEQELRNFLNLQVQNGVMVSADLTGVVEQNQVGDALGYFNVQGQIKQKRLFLSVQNGQIVWNYLSPASENELNYSTDDWSYPLFDKRIIAPIDLIMTDTGIKMYGWFQVTGLPVITKGTNVYLYCNVILPEHQQIVDSLQGVITIEDRP